MGSSSTGGFMGETILIVDDEPDMLDSIEEALVLNRYVVRRAKDGQQAWEMLETENPAIILSDFRMPRLNGAKLFDLVRASRKNKNTPFIFMSATPELITSVGSYSILRKPFVFDTLIREVESSIASRS
jgi:DNA-binding response OmpR family regulator